MIIGYARVSTKDQDLSLQLDTLDAAGCKIIFQEKMTGSTRERPELKKLLEQYKLPKVKVNHFFRKIACFCGRPGSKRRGNKVIHERLRYIGDLSGLDSEQQRAFLWRMERVLNGQFTAVPEDVEVERQARFFFTGNIFKNTVWVKKGRRSKQPKAVCCYASGKSAST